MRNEYLLTPQSYEEKVASAVHEGVNNPARLVDTFVIPDLVGAVEDCIDPEIQHCFKGVYTQHIFRFQKVPVSDRFPMGSKCTYRASALDEFYEFIENFDSPIGKSPRKVLVEWHTNLGERIMIRRPAALDNIMPQDFVVGAVEHMRNVISAIINTSVHPDIKKDWEIFQARLPLVGESPESFIRRRGIELHIPFKNILISAAAGKLEAGQSEVVSLNDETCVGSADFGISLPPPVMAGACMRSGLNLKPEPPRVTIDGRCDATQPGQKLRRSTKLLWRFDLTSIAEGILILQFKCIFYER